MTVHDSAVPAMHEHEHQHPGSRTYIWVAIILAIITGLEVSVFYLAFIQPVRVETLLILSFAKFVLVVGYFMHLKMDDPRFRWMFASGLAVACAVFVALLAMTLTHVYSVPIVLPPQS
jgi:cytochrome c oxidase subunit IV